MHNVSMFHSVLHPSISLAEPAAGSYCMIVIFMHGRFLLIEGGNTETRMDSSSQNADSTGKSFIIDAIITHRHYHNNQ